MNKEDGNRPGERDEPETDSQGQDSDDAEHSGRRLAAVTEDSAGTISFDDLGQPRWAWITERGSGGQRSLEDTFDYLKALDVGELEIADEPPSERRRASKETGYNPYDTQRAKLPRKPRGRG